MAEEAHKQLLNRLEAQDTARKALGPQLAMLVQLVNYGTNLIVRVMHTMKNANRMRAPRRALHK